MKLLNSKALMNVAGGDFASGACHIGQKGYDHEAYQGTDGSGINGDLILSGPDPDKILNIPALVNNGLKNHATGILSSVFVPLPESCR